jgi:hypothetical protein
MDQNALVWAAASAAVSLLVASIYFNSKANILREQLAALREENAKYKTLSDFEIHVEPFVEILKDSSMFTKKKDISLGHQYTLLVHGMPCFQPQRVVTKSLSEIAIDHESIEKLKMHALDLASTALKFTPAGEAATIASRLGQTKVLNHSKT